MPLLLEHCRGAVASTLLECLEDLLVRQGREAQAACVTHVACEIAARHVAERSDHVEQPAIGARLQQDPMPLVLQVETAGDVPAGLLEPPVHLAEAVESVRRGWR
jgi:hypothetical protein